MLYFIALKPARFYSETQDPLSVLILLPLFFQGCTDTEETQSNRGDAIKALLINRLAWETFCHTGGI